MSLQERRKKILAQLHALKTFTNSTTVRQLRRELREKLQVIDAKILEEGQVISQEPKPKKTRGQPNAARAGKMRRYHNYIRQIRNNYPDLSYSQIRSQLTERKRGKQTEIPDVIWHNPSP